MARKILLADDSVTAQNMGRKILADAGYEVITVNNGSAALKKIAELKPDLIVLDVYMPGYSGLEVCQRLKEAQETSRVPVLLTVGKLEPFKPEEAKRVRADGFIVKPFEASELLSALSKLEDKIVPRAESAKPGRFARATAALDEGRYDKSVAIDEDSGWKNRIQFPSKNKAKSAQDDGDDSEIYNAMNKDLRTVVENKIGHEPQSSKPEEKRVDLGALAPEGLPKDVTPEEIAALAAAAAQVKGKIAEIKSSDPAPAEVKTEPKVESTEPGQVSLALPQEITAAAIPVATFTEQKPEALDSRSSEKWEKKKIEASAEKSVTVPVEAPEEAVSTSAPSPADVMAAIAGLEVESVSSSANYDTNSGNGRTLPEADGRASHASSAHDRVADEPATMAVAGGAESAPAAARWAAVAVAVAPEEAALSLELEMQKAFAAAEAAQRTPTATLPEAQPVPAQPTAGISLPVAAPSTEAVAAVPTTPAPAAAPALSEMAATDAISVAVKELEAVAESYLAHKAPASAETGTALAEKSGPASPVATEAVGETHSEAPPATPQPEAKVEENPAAIEQPPAEIAQLNSPAAPEATPQAKADSPAPYDPSLALTAEMAMPTFVNEARAEQTAANEAPASLTSASIATSDPNAPAPRELTNDSDVAATTAAAWASWRHIRESGAPGSGAPPIDSSETAQQKSEEPSSAPHDSAAMAVAAGAEKTPDESASESDSEGIANIVDSVLAGLRPKIFEEISRKMGKKK